jgi:hypothetical protein
MRDTGQTIAYFPPTQSAWLYLDPLKGRTRLRPATFAFLAKHKLIAPFDNNVAGHFYEITDDGKAAIFTL